MEPDADAERADSGDAEPDAERALDL